MDRQVVYPGAIPFDTDLLLQNRNTMIGIGYLAKMVVGDSECYADGLGCMPGNALSVVISPGSLTFPAVVDSGFIGSMPPDGDPLVKIGINTSPTVLPVSGAGTFLLSASFAETQAGDAVVPYYNAANPAQTLFGADGDGNPQASVVQQRVSFALNSGLTPPSGAVPLWVINVPVGATAIDSSMIGLAPGAPFLAVKLPNVAPLTSPSFIGQPNAPTPASGDLSTLLATTAFVSAAARRYRKVWRSAGTSTWVCPAGVTQILFRGWGPGGAGGTGIAGLPGGGGGGGGYLEVLADVVAGQSYAIVVGTGGTITVPGTATSFGGALSAFSGSNGGNGGSGVPGVGGSAGGDAVLQLGALSNPGCTSGQGGYLLGGSNVGGAGGQSFGTASSYPTIGSGAGGAGIWPGGGGAGGANGGGGNGAVGLVILEWCGNSGT